MKKLINIVLVLILLISTCTILTGCDKSIKYFVGKYEITKCVTTITKTYWGKSTGSTKSNKLMTGTKYYIEIQDSGKTIYTVNNQSQEYPEAYKIKGDKIRIMNTVVQDYYLERKETEGVVTLEYYNRIEADDGSKVNKKITYTEVILVMQNDI